MLAPMKTQTTGALTEIFLTVPAEKAESVCKAIHSILELAECLRPLNEDGEELYSAKEVFPESSPGNRLRGLRTREDLTQKEFATALGGSPAPYFRNGKRNSPHQCGYGQAYWGNIQSFV